MNARLEMVEWEGMATSKRKAKASKKAKQETLDFQIAVGMRLQQAQEILQMVSKRRGGDQTLLCASDLLEMVAHAVNLDNTKLPAALKRAANTVATASGFDGLRQNEPKKKAVVARVMVENLVNELRLHGSAWCPSGQSIEQCCAVLIAESLGCAEGERIMLNRGNADVHERMARWANEARAILERADLTTEGRKAAATRIVKRCAIVDGMTTKNADALFGRDTALAKQGRVRRNPTR